LAVNLLRIGIIVAALAVAGVVAFLIRAYLQDQTASIEEQQRLAQLAKITTVKVLVANRDLPAGTVILGSEIEGHIRWQPWPEKDLDKAWVVIRENEEGKEKQTQFAGATVIRGFVTGEPISAARLLMKGESGFMAANLAAGMRAVSININPASAVAGFIIPGSRVDIMLTERFQEPDAETGATKSRIVSEVILADVKILAIDQNVDDITQTAVIGRTATVEVTPKEAEKIAVATALGQLSLSLRSLKPPEVQVSADPFTSELEVSRFLSRDTPVERSPVLVATHLLEPGALLTDADVEWQVLPTDAPLKGLMVKGRFSEPGIRGALVKERFETGQPIREAALVRTGSQGFLTAALAPGMRAISLAVTDVSGVSGYISPGDRVDVVLTHQIVDTSPDAPLGSRKFSETILYDVRVLAIEQTVDESSGKPVIGRTATLELTPKQAESAFLASSMGALALALRGRSQDEPRVTTRPFTSDLELSRAAWELIRGFNRYGPGGALAPQPQPVVEPAPGPLPVAEPAPPPPAPPLPSIGRRGDPEGGRVTVKVYRAVGASRISVKR
jgi:pilus assembly protein CpaB